VEGMSGTFNVLFPVNRMSGFYTTPHPEFVTAELKRVASLNEISPPVPTR
jgi:hypothetical protein